MSLNQMGNLVAEHRKTKAQPAVNGPEAVKGTEAAPFTEAKAWQDVGAGWQPLYGSFRGVGYSIEWHDFQAKEEFNWAASFHPDCLELCLNLEGEAFVEANGTRAEFTPNTVGFYRRNGDPIKGSRVAGQRHQFLTVEYSGQFLAKHFQGMETMLHPLVRSAIDGGALHGPGPTTRLTVDQQQLVATLRQPPVYASAQALWYQCKALELAVTFLVQPPANQEMFCTRQQRVAQERVEQVIFLLKQNLAEPPALEELGRKIGCSHFYLSRIFSNHTGQTITQYLRQLRMDRAAILLRAGEHNVTEVALEVGYASPSHFSQAFHETFGCCPGLYPVAALAQKVTVPKMKKGSR